MHQRSIAFALTLAVMLGFGATAQAGETLGRGAFKGESGHRTEGHASIVRDGGKTMVVLEKDFDHDGAPAPFVGLGKGGYDPKAQLAKLRNNKGKQAYELPAGLDASKYDQVYIWCEKYSVSLGVAKLK